MRRIATGIALLSLLLTACSPGRLPAASGGGLEVVATFSVLGDLVRVVGGEHIELTTLVEAGQDTHTYQPIPAEGAALAEAALVFENGLGFEPWQDDLYESSGSSARRVVVTALIEPISLAGELAGEGAQAVEHGEFDPHVWHNAANAVLMVRQIADALATADPANAEAYRANAAGYTAELQELDAWIFDQVKRVPESHRKLVTTHDTFGYFAEHYGFQVVGTVLPASTEGASPSAQQLAALVEQVKAQGAPAVFAENVSSNTLINQVAAEAGVAVIASLYTDALGPPSSDGDTYLKMMRYNVTTITSALSQ